MNSNVNRHPGFISSEATQLTSEERGSIKIHRFWCLGKIFYLPHCSCGARLEKPNNLDQSNQWCQQHQHTASAAGE